MSTDVLAMWRGGDKAVGWAAQAETPPQTEMGMGGVGGFVPYAAVASLEASAMSGPPDMKVIHLLAGPD